MVCNESLLTRVSLEDIKQNNRVTRRTRCIANAENQEELLNGSMAKATMKIYKNEVNNVHEDNLKKLLSAHDPYISTSALQTWTVMKVAR